MDTRTPGEEQAKDGLTALNNAGREDPNKVGRDRERQVRTIAAVSAGGDADLAPPPKIDAAPAIETAIINGKEVRVRRSSTRRDELSLLYGNESKLPDGTQVNKDGSVFEGVGQPFGTIGSIMTDDGWLVGRIIPLANDEPAPAPGKKKAA